MGEFVGEFVGELAGELVREFVGEFVGAWWDDFVDEFVDECVGALLCSDKLRSSRSFLFSGECKRRELCFPGKKNEKKMIGCLSFSGRAQTARAEIREKKSIHM